VYEFIQQVKNRVIEYFKRLLRLCGTIIGLFYSEQELPFNLFPYNSIILKYI